MMVSRIGSALGKVGWLRRFCLKSEVRLFLQALTQPVLPADNQAALLKGIVDRVNQILKPADCLVWLCESSSGPARARAAGAGCGPLRARNGSTRDDEMMPALIPLRATNGGCCQTSSFNNESSLLIPLRCQDRVFGWLRIGPSRSGRRYTAEEKNFLEVFVTQTALAIYNNRLTTELEISVGQLRRAYQQIIQTQEDERRQLAETLHDETLQRLADLSVRLGLLGSRGEICPSGLDDLQSRLAKSDRGLRDLVRGLHPAVLSDLGLIEAIIAHLETVSLKQHNPPIRISLRVTGFAEQRLPGQKLELALYRLTQNALANALKHSRSSRVEVTVIWSRDRVKVLVKDDGCGTSKKIDESVRAGHFGLLTMRERIEAVGGKFIFLSRPGFGTQVTAIIPVIMSSPRPDHKAYYSFDPG